MNTRTEIFKDSKLTLEAWETLRARFNHDWLKNGLAIALGKVVNVVTGRVEDHGAFPQLVTYLNQWQDRQEEAARLIDATCDLLSPKRFFQTAPLVSLDRESKAFLGEIVDRAWRVRQRPEDLVLEAEQALHELDTAVAPLIRALQKGIGKNGDERIRFLSQIDKTRRAISQLSDVMTRLNQCRRLF